MKIRKIFLKHVTENCITLTKNMQYKLMSPRYLPGPSKSSKNRNTTSRTVAALSAKLQKPLFGAKVLQILQGHF